MRINKLLGVLIVCFLQIGVSFSTVTQLRASSITQVTAGASVTATAILGDTWCVTAQIGPIRCSGIGINDWVITDSVLGPLASKTIIDISGDSSTTCAISSELIAYCWGANANAAVGDNTTVYRSVATPVYTAGALSGVKLKRIAANAYGACAVSTVGRLFCWGESIPSGGRGIYDRFYTGQTQTTHLIPPTAVSDVSLTSLTWVDVEAISDDTICAMSTTGVFKCFGAYIRTYETSLIPTNEGVSSMSASYSSDSVYACALTALGKVFCNGGYYYKDATSSTDGSFGQVALGTTATSVRVSKNSACAVLTNGGVSCWGYGLLRTTGLGLRGYPVVPVLPAGSQVGEAVPRYLYGYDPMVLIRKTTGELATITFSVDTVDGPIPSPIDVSLRTPSISVTDLSLNYPSESGCSATKTQICVSLTMDVDPLSYSTVSYKVYSDQAALNLEQTKNADLELKKLSIGTVDGLRDHWVKITTTGPFGTTTSSVIQIPKQYSPPSSARVSASFDVLISCFNLNVSTSIGDNGGMDGSWSYIITNLKSGTTYLWDGSNGCQHFFKTSSLYAVKAIFTTPAGSTDAITKLSTSNFRLRHRLYRSTRNSIKSTFLVQSSGKQSWTASRGCTIHGGFLIIGHVDSCSIRLKITAVNGFTGSSETYSIKVF